MTGRKRYAARWVVPLVPLLMAGALFSAAASSEAASKSRPSPTATKVGAFVPAALAEVSPGLCLPGDTPLCIGAAQDQVHIYSQACTAMGAFERRALAAGTPCGIDLSAFMDPSLGFPKPNCVTTHTYTSNKATAFGKPVNEVTVGRVSRRIQLSYPFALASSRTATGWMDGPDRNRNPVGDHRLVFSVQVRPHQGSPPVCVTEPFTGGDVTAVMHITD
jgi:hypothetical protein